MRKPLSFSVYIKSNIKKTLGMIISIALGIFLIAVIEFYTNSMIDTYMRGQIKYNYMSTIWGTKDGVHKDILNKIENSSSVQKIMTVSTHGYSINNAIGSNTSCQGFDADENNIKYIMDKMGLKLMKGEIPKNGEKKIVINENVARARNLKIGDYMGRDASNFDWFSGKYKVCGIMKGDNIISFIARSEEEIKKDNTHFDTYLIIPKDGKLCDLNKFLKILPKEGISTCTYDSIQSENDADEGNFNLIFNVVIIVMIVVLSVCLGNSAYVHYYQRRMEFGLLESVGFGQGEIIFRAFKEIFISSIIGFAAGFLLIETFVISINKFYLYPHGLSFFTIKADLIIRIIAIPLFICIFSLIPASRLLSRIEPISIIERNE